MSTTSVQSFPVVGLYNKTINANAAGNQSYVAHKGAAVNTVQVYPSSSYSTTSWQFTTNPPNNKICVNRRVLVKSQVRLTFNTDIRSGLGTNVGLRQFPLNSIFQNVTCTINNNQSNVTTSDVLHPLLRYAENHWRIDRINSTSASMPDEYQNFADWANPQYGGSNRNPLAAYGENYSVQNRGAIQPDVVASDGTYLIYTLTEPLFLLSPFIDDEAEHLGFYNVSTFAWNFNLVQNFGARMWCSDQLGPNITSVVGSFESAPQLIFNYLTPPMIMYIPDSISYPYYNIISYPNPDQTVASGATAVFTTNNIQLTEIPKRFYVYVRRQNTDLFSTNAFLYADAYASITNLNVTFNNLTSIFSTFPQESLYDMALKNGLEMSYQEFKNFCGSVIAIESTDLGLPATLSAGSLGQFNLTTTITITNTSTASVTYTPYIVVINEGIMSIGSQGTIVQTGILSRAAVLDSTNLPQVSYDEVVKQGGSIFGRLKSFLENHKPFLNRLSRVGQTLGTVGEQFGVPGARVLRRVSDVGRELTGGRKSRMYRRGRGLYGAGLVPVQNNQEEIDEIDYQ